MNLLIDKLPTTVTISGAEVSINWDFRTSIEFSDLLEKGNDNQMDLVNEALELYFPALPDGTDAIEVVEQMLWFYRCGREEKKRKSKDEVLSYSQDAGFISAAFLEQYNIDFQVIENMHWWKFRALFDSLKDDTQIVKIMGYRGADISKLPKEEKEFYKKMKKEYSLKKNKTSKREQELLDKIDAALERGEDVTPLLEELNKE